MVIDFFKIEGGQFFTFGSWAPLIIFLEHIYYLGRVLGIKKGDTYNGVLLEKRIADKSKPDAEDLTNLYQNKGYLFFLS